MKFIIILINICLIFTQTANNDLSIDILPSEKYRLDKRDLGYLKSDIERQVNNLYN
jgi:hypothetical protein